MTTTTKRKETDVMKLMMKDFKVEMPDDEMSEFCVEFHGPDGSLYEGGVWKIRVELPDDYPFKYPLITFENKIYHPNIDEGGGVICLDVIRQAWSPMFDLVNVFEAFLPQLLLYPNPSDPLNKEAGALMLSDPSSYNAKVKEYCQRYAKPAEIAPPKDSDEDELTEDEKDSGDDQRSIANDMQNLQITEDENDSSDDQSAGTSDPK